ncbi:MAG: GNAT family N-acetyltransferase [Clostridium sp.]|nr:GNAT family N-acetyltransferase [Clostridium sp.]
MKEEMSYEIRPAEADEWEEAMGLAWKTFLEFEAGDYTPEGVRSFEDFITDSELKRMFLSGEYRMLAAYCCGKMVGMITLRNETHISLLFVDKNYHRHGVGRALIQRMADYVRHKAGGRRMTVNASPYGVAFYHRIGFKDLGSEREQDGIIYTPMEYIISEK